MRTTIEVTAEHRSRLLEESARRGEKGFSGIVEQALDRYFAAEEERRQRVDRALAAVGSLSAPAARRMQRVARELRQTWR